jgi:hypothetical protein
VIVAALARTGCHTVYPYFAGTAHLALILGQRLNATAWIRCYERVLAVRYVPACLLFGEAGSSKAQPG